MRRWRRWTGASLAAALAVGVATVTGSSLLSAGRTVGGAMPSNSGTPKAELVAYDSCSQMLSQLRSETLAQVGRGQVFQGNSAPTDAGPVRSAQLPAAGGSASDAAGSAADSPAGATPAPAAPTGTVPPGAGSDFSTTNDQEAGVDEPDLAKTDGHVLVALSRSTDTLQVADVGATPSLTGSVDLSSLVEATGLFLVGTDAVLLGDAISSGTSSPGAPPTPQPVPAQPPAEPSDPPAVSPPDAVVVPVSQMQATTEVVVVDVSDPARPAVARSFALQGSEVDARLIAGRVEVVVSSTPDLPLVAPVDQSPAAMSTATSVDRSVVSGSGAADWLPSVTSQPSGTTTVAPCTSALHTVSSTGVDTIGIVPIDPNSDQPGTEVTVVGDATTVYASTTSLYVAYASPAAVPLPEPAPGDVPAPGDTVIDAFDLSDPTAPRYIGSGQVPGTLIGQYAMSEYQGDLRVATTVGDANPAPGEGTDPSTPSDNRITVLSVEGQTLAAVGSLTGLGTGEKIYAVRFAGPLAYVVTFDQTDPLFVLDLSDPLHPQTAGQLPLTGYSSFLEPLANGLLLGVGEEVDSNLRPEGLQVSLFDVSNPASPTLVAKDVLAGASSSAQDDPHALLYWAASDLVVLPVQQGVAPAGIDVPALGTVSPTGTVPPTGTAVAPTGTAVAPGTAPGDVGGTVPGSTDAFDGAIAWRASSGALAEAGRITQPPVTGAVGAPGIERDLVVGAMLYSVSDTGILVSNLSSLTPSSWMPYQ